MIEAYQVGVTIAIGGNPGTAVGALAEQFEVLDKVIKRVQMSVNELVAGMRGLGRVGDSAAQSWRAAASAMERAARAARSAGGSLTGGGGGNGGGAGGGGSASRALVPLLAAPAGYRGGGGGPLVPYGPGGGSSFPGGGPIALNYKAPTAGKPLNATKAGLAAYAGYEVVRSTMEEAIDADSIIAQMNAQSAFSSKDVEASKNLARRLVSDVPGMGYAEALKLILQTSSFTGDSGEALKMAPGLARNAQILSLFGKRDAIEQVQSGIKAGELTGLTDKEGKIDVGKLMSFVTGLTNTVVSSGGTTDINKYLTSIRQFGAGADAAGTDFLLNVLPAYQKIMGESKAGTALQSFQQSLLAARPNTQNKAILEEQKRLGIRGADGHLSADDAELLSRDTNAFITSRVLPALYAGGYDTPEKIRGELPKFLPRNTMERLVAAGIFDEGVISKEADRNRQQQASGGPLGDKLLAESPQNQVKAFMEAFRLMQASFGDAAMKPLTEGMRALADFFKHMGDWAKEHPDGAKDALLGLAGAITFLGSAAVLKMLGELGGSGGKLALLGAGIGILAGQMDSLPGWLIQAATGAAIGAKVGGAPGAAVGAAAFIGGGVGSWIDRNVPGASAIDDFVARQTGGMIGLTYDRQQPKGDGKPIRVEVVNGSDLARGVTDIQTRQLSRPSTGTTGGDNRASPDYGLLGVPP